MLSLKRVTIFSHFNYGAEEKKSEYFGEQIGLRFAFGISEWGGTTLT
jgi:hypothetical protein